MAVTFDEAGDGQAPVQIDHFGRWADVGLNRLIRSHRDDLAIPRGHRLSGCVLLQGDDLAAAQDQVGRLRCQQPQGQR